MHQRLPIALRGLDSDNGPEFINQGLYGSRLAWLHVNFFQPVQKLVTKTHQGARVHRFYDRAQTPYQCLGGPVR